MRILSLILIAVIMGAFLSGCEESTTVAIPDSSVPPNLTGVPAYSIDSPSFSMTNYVLYGVSSAGDALSILDPATGATTLVGPLDPDPKIFVTPIAMAVRACDGGVFVWNNSNAGDEPNSSVSDGRLLTVDTCTGLGTAVNAALPSQGQLAALAFHPDGRLFGTDSRLVEIDPETGEVTNIGTIGVRIAGADFHPVTGVLYGAELGGTKRFGTIDIETGAFTEIGTLEDAEGVIVGSIAFDPSGDTLFGTTASDPGGVIFEINIETAEVSNSVQITGVVPQGMGFGPVCGEDGGDCGQDEIELTLVIKPGSCPNPLNPKSRGVLPMAILGGSETEIDDIDVSSIEINGVAALRFGHGDVGGPAGETTEECECAEGDPDGVPDLTLKFKTQDIVATLGSVSRGDIIELTLTGMLSDGADFETSACVVIVGK